MCLEDSSDWCERVKCRRARGKQGDQSGDTEPGESNRGGEKMLDTRHFKRRSNKIC